MRSRMRFFPVSRVTESERAVGRARGGCETRIALRSSMFDPRRAAPARDYHARACPRGAPRSSLFFFLFFFLASAGHRARGRAIQGSDKSARSSDSKTFLGSVKPGRSTIGVEEIRRNAIRRPFVIVAVRRGPIEGGRFGARDVWRVSRYDAIIRAIDCRLPRSFAAAFRAPRLVTFPRILPPRRLARRRSARRCVVCGTRIGFIARARGGGDSARAAPESESSIERVRRRDGDRATEGAKRSETVRERARADRAILANGAREEARSA